MTALRAMTNIPPERAAQIVRIEARDGTPTPDRWYLITYDPQSESGFREYAVTAEGQAPARTVSQFVESASSEQVIPMTTIKLDSDQAYKHLEAYASAHGLTFSKTSYVLKKDQPDAAPMWLLTCLDDAGRPLAALTMTAAEGKIVAQKVFNSAPIAAGDKKETVAPPKTELAANRTSDDKTSAPHAKAADNADTQPAKSSVKEKQSRVAATTKSEVKMQLTTKEQIAEKKPRQPKPDSQTTDSGVRLQNFFTGHSPI